MLLIFLSLLLILGGCSSTVNIEGPSGFIQVKGSDTMVNAAQRLAEEFMKDYPYIFVAVTGGGSGVGIASLINKTCDVTTASRKIKKKELAIAKQRNVFPKEFVVAYDGIAVIVHKENPVDRLTIEQLHKIYTGKITNWKELGGRDAKIVLLSREVNSGTHVYFKEEVVQLGKKLKEMEFSPQALLLSSSQAIVEEVVNNKDAIGYLGMGYVSERVKAVKISKDNKHFFAPTVGDVSSGSYPLARPLYMYTNGEPSGITKLFIDFTLSSKGQKVFKETGFTPLKTDVSKTD